MPDEASERPELIEAYRLAKTPIRRYPTRIRIRCPACQHQATIALFLEQVSRLKCSHCGDRHPIIADREPLRAWSRYRRR